MLIFFSITGHPFRIHHHHHHHHHRRDLQDDHVSPTWGCFSIRHKQFPEPPCFGFQQRLQPRVTCCAVAHPKLCRMLLVGVPTAGKGGERQKTMANTSFVSGIYIFACGWFGYHPVHLPRRYFHVHVCFAVHGLYEVGEFFQGSSITWLITDYILAAWITRITRGNFPLHLALFFPCGSAIHNRIYVHWH